MIPEFDKATQQSEQMLKERLATRDEAWWRREIPARDQGWAHLRTLYARLRTAEVVGDELDDWQELARFCISAVVSEIEWREREQESPR